MDPESAGDIAPPDADRGDPCAYFRNVYGIHITNSMWMPYTCQLFFLDTLQGMLGERLKAARQRAGLRQVELAAALGDRYDHSVISAVEHGRSVLRYEGLVKAAQTLGVSLDYLVGLTDDPVPPAERVPALTDLVMEAGVVPLRDVRAAGGWGADVDQEPIVGHLAFPSRWLRRHGIRPSQCSVIEVVGDSMEPTLEDGGWILVDHQSQELQRRRIFVVRTEDGLIVKRVDRQESGWRLCSDNPDYSPIDFPWGAAVIGRVVWTGKSL